MIIKSGDEYQGFRVKETSKDGIVLANSKAITLNLDKDEKNYFTDSWYFQTSDAGKGSSSPQGYIIYPATDVILENKSAVAKDTDPNGGKSAETNLIDMNNAEISVTQEDTAEKTANKTESGEKSYVKTPGFEVLLGIIGISLPKISLNTRD